MTLTLRSRLLLVVLAVGVAPLIFLGAWLNRATLRGGEQLLRDRLRATLDRESGAIGAAWIPLRSDLLDVAALPSIRDAVGDGRLEDALRTALDSLDPAVEALAVTEDRDRTLAEVEREDLVGTTRTHALGGSLTVRFEIDSPQATSARTLLARLSFGRLRIHAPSPTTTAAVVLAFEPASGDSLLPSPFNPEIMRPGRFEWAGEEWVAEFEPTVEPPLVLGAAAPLAVFTGPFSDARRTGLLLLVAVALAGLVAVAALTTRMTASLQRLADAADALAAGDLDHETGVRGRDEVGRVARAFDAMTKTLRRTLAELAEQRSLAAVGEFAAALAHEIRNPLTSIKLDLQEVEESLPRDSSLRHLQESAIEEIDRLDRTVGETLAMARSGKGAKSPVDLVALARRAAQNARAVFAERKVSLLCPPEGSAPVEVFADADGMVRVLLNLLRNAAEALPPGGSASIEVVPEDGWAVVRVRDDGPGIPPEELERIFEPFYSTRSGGTGLGLVVARRIVVAHAGEIAIESEEERGTEAIVRLPAVPTGTNRFDRPAGSGTNRSVPLSDASVEEDSN